MLTCLIMSVVKSIFTCEACFSFKTIKTPLMLQNNPFFYICLPLEGLKCFKCLVV